MVRAVRPDLFHHTPKAQKLRKLIRDCIDLSYRTVSMNFHVWDDIEEHYRAFRPIDEDDIESIRKNNVQKIVVPIQFATMQTMTTFMMEVFTALKPVLRVRGADPTSVHPARIMELLLDYDYRGNRGYFFLQQWFLNAYRYGYAPAENSWETRQVLRKRMGQSKPAGSLMIEGVEYNVPGDMQYVNDWFTTFEGNKWTLIDPRTWFPDPRVPISRFQDGQFCGRRTYIHDNDLRKMEDSSLFFNVGEIPEGGRSTRGGATRDSESGMDDNRRSRINPMQALELELTEARRSRMHVNEQIIIELEPAEYDLSDEDRPQQWLFNLIDDDTIVRAEQSPFIRFNFEVLESYPDMLATMSQGLMELTEPLSDHMSFLFNSHMANVRKAINDMLVVDPSKIDLRDLLDPKAGKIIRLLPAAYNMDLDKVVKQLVVQDITQGHIADSKMIIELWERITGATSAMFGQVAGGRRTAAELQGVFKSSGSRMKMQADVFSSEGVAPFTEQMSILRQENMSEEQFIEIAGVAAERLGVQKERIVEGFMKVQRDHIQGNFHFPAEEGVLPQDRAQMAEILKGVFETVAKAPFLTQAFDPVEIFKESVRQYGMHNIDDFLRKGVKSNVQIVPPDVVRNGVAKKQLAPVGRPDQGVRTAERSLTTEGFANGAGRPRD